MDTYKMREILMNIREIIDEQQHLLDKLFNIINEKEIKNDECDLCLIKKDNEYYIVKK